MLNKKVLPSGLIEVSSDKGLVDIGNGAVKKIIASESEIEYIEEIENEIETN